MKKISLTQGKYALVDNKDFEWLSQWKWCFLRGCAVRGVMKNRKRWTVYMHREVNCTPKDKFTDHINGNALDNRRLNLRICSTAENSHNQKIRKGGTSKYKGVYWYKRTNRWRASITLNCKITPLGYFKNELDAAKAYNRADL